MMRIKPPSDDNRSAERIRIHYEIERNLADRLRHANNADRQRLYPMVYDELFRRVPDMPMLTRGVDTSRQHRAVARQFALLSRFVRPGCVFLEIGAGDCALSLEMARTARHVYAVDVSSEIAGALQAPENFHLAITDGTSIPVPPDCVDVAYSLSLIEHLHPDDALIQLKNILRALKPGGVYVCLTPNRLNGPHDISKYFDDEAKGLHLKEYTNIDLSALYRQAGFRAMKPLAGPRERTFFVPLALVTTLEAGLLRLPRSACWRIASWPPMRVLLGIKLVGWK
ncbi:MAG TPA: methyltransferase domain-containing protein [Anaerolineae bacterium]|nr:methyltransferase domain-containing protein [Anaerolineae bacterium]